MKKTGFWLCLVIFSLVGQIAWVVENMYLNVFIYKSFNASPSDISAMVMASAVTAALTTVVIGALSDKMGKRKIFICGGYIAWGISITSFALLRVDILSKLFPAASAVALGISLTIVIDCVMTFFGSSANDAAFNAWLTDSTDHSNRGRAEGINAIMPLIAMLAVFGGFMAFDLDKGSSWTAIFLIIGICVFIIGILGCFLMKETPVNNPENSRFFANMVYGFRPAVIKDNVSLYLSLIAFALFGISIQIFMPYLIIYYESSLKMENYVLIMAPAIIIASVISALYGRLYDKFGFRATVFPSVLALVVGYVIMIFSRTVAPVFIGSLTVMIGYLSSSAVFGAGIRDKTPAGKAGMFQGLRIVCQVLIPGVVGPAIGAAILKNAKTVQNNDGTFSFLPDERIFIASLAAAVVLAGFLGVILRKKRSN